MPVSAIDWDALTHGTRGLLVGYGVVAVPMLVGLIQRRAALRQFLRWPLAAVFVQLLAVALWSALSWSWGRLGVSLPAGAVAPVGLLFFAAVGYATGLFFAGSRSASEVKRGAVVEDGARLQKLTRRWKKRNPDGITLAGVGLSTEDEKKHFKIIGTTGTGKSTAIRAMIEAALARGDRVVIADPDGGYLQRFYDPTRGDLILNPFDPRSHTWDLFGEIEQPYDVEQLARSLIPDQDGSDRSWRGYARTFFVAITRQLWELGRRDASYRTVSELYRLITMAPTEELKLLVAHTPAQPFLEEGNERMFGSIRSVASASLAGLEHIGEQRSTPLSIRQWIRTGQRGALFLPYSANQISALRAGISAWMRLAIFETMSTTNAGAAERDQHLWFVVDELDALGQIDGLKDALARLRKFGGRCVLGFQSIAQVSGTYGASEAQTIVENCGNTLILRCSASEKGGTAAFASRLIGEREVVRMHESQSTRSDDFSVSRTRSEQHVTESAVLPSEIEQLPDLEGYLRIASEPTWLRVKL
jgi:type IV secretory pathway TraG/TraD family ATPase VirD4